MRRRALVGAAFVGAALFAWSAHDVGVVHLRAALQRIGWGFVAIVGLAGLREAARTLAWVDALERPDRLSFGDAFRARLAGEALSTLLPMGILVGEPAKAEYVGHRLPFSTAFGALAMEFAFYGVSVACLLAAGAAAVAPVWSLAVALPAPLVAWRAAPARIRALAAPVVEFAARDPLRAARILLLEAAYQFGGVVEAYLALMWIGPRPAAWTSALVLETVSRGITMLFKVVPMRVGVDEAGAALIARHLDVDAAAGVTLALVRKVRALLWSGVGLALLLMRPSKPSRSGRPFAAHVDAHMTGG